MRRIVRPEILDTAQASSEDVNDSLIDLQRINRWFGGVSTVAALVDSIIRRTNAKQLSLLDVASASGDIPESIHQRLLRRGIRLNYTLLDRDPVHFSSNDAPRVRGDALALPFRDHSFDLVTCSLFAHHLEPPEIELFATEALRVCRIAFLVNDLRRSYLHLAAIYGGQPLFRPITRHDSIASVWRAYTRGELREILKRTAAREITMRNTYLFRMGAIAWK